MDSSSTVPIITTPAALAALVERLRPEPLLAFDLEADSMHHYRERVCLLQVSGSSETVLIDPLVLHDLSPLSVLLSDPAIRKILHGADYDIRSLHRDFGLELGNLFDTMIACQFLGEPEVGLAAILRKRFGAELDKKYQKADWSRRPLQPEMVAYAAEDTRLLIPLYGQLVKELDDKGRLSWVEEECEILSSVRSTARVEGELFYLKFKGASRLSRRSLAVLEEVLAFRDARAAQQDLPPFKILSTDTVRHLAENPPERESDLEKVPGLSRKLIDRYGAGLLEVTRRALMLPEEKLPYYPRQAPPVKDPLREGKVKKLKQWREQKAAELRIEPGILANNALLENLAGLRKREELPLVPSMRRWQRELFGEQLMDIVLP